MTTVSGVTSIKTNKIPWHCLRYKVGASGHHNSFQRTVSRGSSRFSLLKHISGCILVACMGRSRSARSRTLPNTLSTIRAYCVPILCELAGGANDELRNRRARPTHSVMTQSQPQSRADADNLRPQPHNQTELSLCFACNRAAFAVLPRLLIKAYIPFMGLKTFKAASFYDV